MPQKLSETEIRAALAGMPEWSMVEGKLHREYLFADFVHAFGFMATCATAIEAMNHHPEWSNVWNRVTVNLTTHDAGGITDLDLRLAELLEKVAKKLQS
ncbi:MAG: 4a-hydroxytetrahydrobiopterin dehydratase [Bryobacteraceae bacterium]